MVTRRRTGRKKTAGARRGRTTASLVSLTPPGSPARRGGGWVLLVLAGLVLVNLYVFVWDKETSVAAIKREAHAAKTTVAAVPSQPLLAATPAPDLGGAATATNALAAAIEGDLDETGVPVAPPGLVEGAVAPGDTLGRLLKKSGLSAAETDEVIRSLSGILDFRSIRAGQQFRLERGPDGRVDRFSLVISKIQTVVTERGAEGELVGVKDVAETNVRVASIGGRIDSSLYAALKDAGEHPALVDFFVDVFAYDLDFFNDTHAGDTFRVVVEKELTEDGAFHRYKRILAAEYRGKAGTFRTFAFKDGYYGPDGETSEKTFLKTPLKFSRISSKFDRKRMHPVLHTTRAHLGIDYAAPTGTPVWAAAAGVITHRAPSGGAGNMVIVRHAGGLDTVYMHLHKFAAGQKVGQKIAAKTVIGYVGTTGLSTGPHLHFGVKQNGAYIDPSKVVPIRGRRLGGKELATFQAEVTRLRALLAVAPIVPGAPATPALAAP